MLKSLTPSISWRVVSHAMHILLIMVALQSPTGSADWPMLGKDSTRNAVSPGKSPPIAWDVNSGRNIKWTATLGSMTHGTPVVAGGQVYIGTNNGDGYIERYPSSREKSVDLGCLYIVTGNGVDESHVNLPAPEAPSLVCLDKHTGNVLWTDHSPGANVLHTQVASPLVAEIAGKPQVIVPQGDGWVRVFDALTGELIWEFDLNFKESKWILGGEGTRNTILATPVLYRNRIYLAATMSPQKQDCCESGRRKVLRCYGKLPD